jgi:hypothetical protein
MQPRASITRSKRFNDEKIAEVLRTIQEHKKSDWSSENTQKPLFEGCLLPKVRTNEDSRYVSDYYSSMKRMTFYSALLGAISTLAAFCEGEITQNRSNEGSWLANTIRGLVIVLSLLQVACLVRFYSRLLLTRIARGLVTRGTKLRDEPRLRQALVIEVILAALVCPPGLYIAFPSGSIEHPSSWLSLGDVLFCLTCIRLYQLFKLAYWRMRQPQDFFIL